MESILETINLGNYFHLIRELLPEVRAIGAFHKPGHWVRVDDAGNQTELKAVEQDIREAVMLSDQQVYRHALADKRVLYLVCLNDLHQFTVGRLAILQSTADENSTVSEETLERDLLTIAELAQKEIALNSELNMMSNELTERYEELNMVYEYDPNSIDGIGGEASLEYLVNSCTNFLAVAMSGLVLPEQNIAIFDYAKDRSRLDPSIVLPILSEDVYAWIKQYKQSIVINSLTEEVRKQCCANLPYKLIAVPVFSSGDKVIGVLAILQLQKDDDFSNSDRNLLDVMSKKITKVINLCFDPLTGLKNANNFESILDNALSHSRLNGVSHALIHFDIDKLQVVNDISGRQAGDQLISLVGSTIRRLIRNRDNVARLGADKFGVLLDDCPIHIAEDLAQKIRDEIKSLVFEWEEEKHNVSVSVGIAPVTPTSESVAGVLSAVEAARDLAKERGRNQLKIFKQDDINLLYRSDEVRWVTRIQNALSENTFELYAQLIKPLQDEDLLPHYEILLRMRDDDGQIISPGAFLPAAEHYSLMPEIDRWVVKHTLTMMADAPCRVSINLSGQSLCNEGFLEFLVGQISKSDVRSENISFEVTESAAIANLEEAKRLISTLKKLECNFSLDDFGTGLSSFNYLKNLDVDYLKIDGSFVKEIDSDEVSAVMVKAIHEVGKAIGLKTIAEFVENDSIKNRLADIGVDYGQGYGLGKPMPFADVLNNIAELANS